MPNLKSAKFFRRNQKKNKKIKRIKKKHRQADDARKVIRKLSAQVS